RGGESGAVPARAREGRAGATTTMAARATPATTAARGTTGPSRHDSEAGPPAQLTERREHQAESEREREPFAHQHARFRERGDLERVDRSARRTQRRFVG